MNVVESQTRLCPSKICSRAEPSTGSRLSSLYSDARTVYLHLLAPPKLEDRLPNIDESWGNFGSDAGDELESETLPKVNMHTFYIGRVQDFNRFIASFRAPDRRQADALLPARADAARPVALLPRRPRAGRREPARRRDDARAVVELEPRDAGVAAAPAAGRLHRQAARPARQPAEGGRPLGQVARRSSTPTTGSASAAATSAASRRGRTSPISRSSRSS